MSKKRRRRTRSNPKRARARRVRRGNPSVPVLLANPRRRRKARRGNPSMAKIRGMVAGMMGSKRKRRRRVRRGNPKKLRTHFRRRRSNPGAMPMGVASVIRIGIAGGLGIVTSRIAGYLYNKYVAPIVLGDEGRADPSSWRAILNDVVRVVAQEIAILGIERIARKANLGSPTDRLAFAVGGTAETVRQGLGLAVNRLSPGTDRAAYGLDGNEPSAYVGEDGRVYVLDERSGEYYLDDGDDDDGMGELVEEDTFGELVEEDDFE